MIGIIPGSFVFVNLGQTLGRIDSLSGLLSTETIGAFVLLGLLALIAGARPEIPGVAGGEGMMRAVADRRTVVPSDPPTLPR